MLVPPEACTQKPAWPAVFSPHDPSMVQSIVHQMSLLQFGTTPPSAAAHAAHGEPVSVEQGSPTAPFVPAQIEFVEEPDWMPWHVVPE
jgi:hypothetical protein